MAKITKFGNISENENGVILINDFDFDMEGGDGNPEDFVGLIIERLRYELLNGDFIEENVERFYRKH